MVFDVYLYLSLGSRVHGQPLNNFHLLFMVQMTEALPFKSKILRIILRFSPLFGLR